MNRKDIISNIIEKRKPLAEKIKKVKENLRKLNLAINTLERKRQELLQQSNYSSKWNQSLQSIDFSNILLKISNEQEALEKLRLRFERPTLNLGVVGIARQGKSRLLQSLTGLSPNEIPDGDKGHCTGARSIIYHRPQVATYGMVWFHTEESFLKQVIKPYFEKLSLGEAPDTIEEFAQPLPRLSDEHASNPISDAKYRYLQKYHEHLHEYRDLLKTESPRQIEQKEIRQYVAQDDIQGNRNYFNYLAIQRVNLFCEYPNTDVADIALVDMPGLGDTGVGAEEELIRILGEEVDAVMFVRLPKSSGDDWLKYDIELYGTAKQALLDRLPINKWSFMILNRTEASSGKGDNLAQCDFLVKRLDHTPIKVVEPVIVANCANPEEANTKILDRVLDYLVKNIELLDNEYSSFCDRELLLIHKEVNTQLNNALSALGNPAVMADAIAPGEFRRLFKPIWQKLANGLEQLLRDLRESGEKERIKKAFSDKIQDVKKYCQESKQEVIPSLEEIDEVRNIKEGSYENAYNFFLNKCRTHLSRQFLKIDNGLEELINGVKSQVTDVLIDAGKLGSLTDAQGAEFLKFMAEYLSEYPDSLKKLQEGFQLLSDFHLSYRNLFQHRIREQLDDITPDRKSLNLTSNPSADEILDKLNLLYEKVKAKCIEELEEFASEPGDAAFGIVEEFVDQVLRSKDAEDAWQDFYENERAQIWASEFAQERKLNEIRKNWLNLVERAAVSNQLDSMVILN
ncbi:hypothetical protein NIES2100_68050 [Calothrix sp. NIES-2100]|uniref:hypothetical protein n=1 Tax=Calothrix sp. NIES-2100 TaxID=1954172 RepID=UPI000B600462|nr:hypothetical protein NIES2100_68050 [Calothrix sp. NIES-2100]